MKKNAMTTPRSVIKLATVCLRLGSLLWLAIHFVFTIGYVMPLTPITLRYRPVLEATIGRFFYQNWSLFAPNPVSSDQALLVRGLDAAEVSALPRRGLPVDGWQDISTPMWRRFHTNRFSAYDRLSRPQANGIRQYLGAIGELEPLREGCSRGDASSCNYYEEQLKRLRSQASTLLAKVGSAFLRDAFPSGQYTHLALRLRETYVAPWPARYTGPPPRRDVELGVYTVDSTVATTGLYRAGDVR